MNHDRRVAASDFFNSLLAGIAVKLALWVHNDGEPIGIDETMHDAHCPEMVSAWRDAIRRPGA